MWCGDLTAVFTHAIMGHIDPQQIQMLFLKQEIGKPVATVPLTSRVMFPNLKHIHLHELPKLHHFYSGGPWGTHAPNLETLKVRGCWNLRALPNVENRNVVVCDCEKEWWDMLKWDSKLQLSHYKPIHSRYYKKAMLRGSPLR
jgi:hypothetical protein